MRTDSTRVGREGEARPMFCPACRRGRRGDSRLCAYCGDSLIAQGFCPVCRQHWLLPVGSDCPKHDLRLDQPQPEGDFPVLEGEIPSWATIAAFAHPIEAQGPRLSLEAEGIPTFLDGERMAGHAGAIAGSVRLQVPRHLLDHAREALTRPPEFSEDESSLPEFPPEEPAEADDPADPSRRALVWWAVGLVSAIMVLSGLASILKN